ncbi:MAG: Uma2 family endonuclease [Bacteroidetes bacterium]|nr:Uma2 family endonuclease [Bacteroidota bacterium]
MGAGKLEKPVYSFQEYLKMEEESDKRHEFHAGEVLAMSGGTLDHGIICNSVGTAIDIELDKTGQGCLVTNSDVKVYIEKFNHYIYPDIMVLCDDEQFHDESKTIVTNPLLVIEALSKSTKFDDKGAKFDKYITLPSLKEYVLVWQTVPKVESWYREENNLWRISNVFGFESSISLHSINCQIALKDIYKRIKNLGKEDSWNAY